MLGLIIVLLCPLLTIRIGHSTEFWGSGPAGILKSAEFRFKGKPGNSSHPSYVRRRESEEEQRTCPLCAGIPAEILFLVLTSCWLELNLELR